MTINEFGRAFEYNIEHNLKYAVLGLGAPGVGKSQIIRQIGRKYGYKVIDIRLAQMSEVEIGGLIYPNENRTKTVWLAPDVLPNEERDGKNTILLLDEITSCTKRVQVAAYQLILDRKIGQYTLPEGCFVVALGNTEDDDGVYVQLAAPLADRFEIHYIEPDFDSWKHDYALKAGVHRLVIDYLTFKPSALHTQKQQEAGSMRFATPRSWDRVSDILKSDSDVNNPVVASKIIGNIGEREGRQFIEYCKKHEDFTSADDFIYNVKKEPDDPAKLSILIKAIADKLTFIKDMRSLSDMNSTQRKTADDVIQALFRLKHAEYTLVGIQRLNTFNRPLIKHLLLETDTPAIQKFIESNAAELGTGGAGLNDKTKSSWLELWK